MLKMIILRHNTPTYLTLIFLATLLTGCGGAQSPLMEYPDTRLKESYEPKNNSTNSKLFAGDEGGGGNAQFVASSLIENIKLISLPGDTDPATETPSLIGYLNHLLVTLAQQPESTWDSGTIHNKLCGSSDTNKLTFQLLESSTTQNNRYEITVSNCSFGTATINGKLTISSPQTLAASAATWSIDVNIEIESLSIYYQDIIAVKYMTKDRDTAYPSPRPLRFTSYRDVSGNIETSLQVQNSGDQSGYLTILLPNGNDDPNLSETNKILNESSTALATFTSSYTIDGNHTLDIASVRFESFTGDNNRFNLYSESPVSWGYGNTQPPYSGGIKIIGGDNTSASIKIIDTYGSVELYIYENKVDPPKMQNTTITQSCPKETLTWDELPYIRNTSCASGGGSNTDTQNGVAN